MGRNMGISVLTAAVSLMAVLSCTDGKEQSGASSGERVMTVEERIEIDNAGGPFSIDVKANFDFNVQPQDEWIAFDKVEGDKVWFTAEANENVDSRIGKVRFTDPSDKYFYKEVRVSQEGDPSNLFLLSIVDKNATAETKALYANLWDIASRGFMFGHHDDLWYGRYWYNEPGKSDTKSVCGDYPGVFSVDMGPIMDDRHNNTENAIRRRVIIEAYDRGEVITMCCHLNNPHTGGDSWDNSSNKVVSSILTEGHATRTKYLQWLDRCADFANNLRGSDGKLIPIIFRPYHEHTQTWSWWGSKCTTEAEFISFWRFTVEYLRDVKQVRNFIYAVSPQMDEVYSDAKGRLTFRWPGDDYVDFIGMDCYHYNWKGAFKSNLDAMSELSREKKKPCGVTETGPEGFDWTDYWTNHILECAKGQRVSMIVMWRNKYVSSESDRHFYSVYPGHPSEGDFRDMYDDPSTFFSKDLPDMYDMPANYQVK
jgi:beta-mannanase